MGTQTHQTVSKSRDTRRWAKHKASETGTPQGGVISPLIAILHAVTTSVFYRHILADSCVDKTVA